MGTGIYNIVKAKITTEDLGTLKTQANKMKEATKDEPGTLIYDFFINEEKREVLIVEKYANSEAFMVHIKRFIQPEYIPTILTMQEITSVEMPGKITKEMEQFFAEGGWSYNAYPLNV